MEKSRQKKPFCGGWEETDLEIGYRTSMLQTLSKILSHFETQEKEEQPKSFGKTIFQGIKKTKAYPASEIHDLLPSCSDGPHLQSLQIASNKTSRASSKRIFCLMPYFKTRLSKDQPKYYQTQQPFQYKRSWHSDSPTYSIGRSRYSLNPRNSSEAQHKQETYEAWKNLVEARILKQKAIMLSKKNSVDSQRNRLKLVCLCQQSQAKKTIKPKLKHFRKVKAVFENEKQFEDIKIFRG